MWSKDWRFFLLGGQDGRPSSEHQERGFLPGEKTWDGQRAREAWVAQGSVCGRRRLEVLHQGSAPRQRHS